MVYNIQFLRAVAALLVVVYHIIPMLIAELGASSELSGIHAPAIGVDIFFLISGFIMVVSNKSLSRNTTQFWWQRLVRVAPLYWFITFIIMTLVFLGLNPNGVHAFDIGDVLGSLAFLPVQRLDGVNEPIVSLGWTLIYEMFFYFIFGAFLAVKDMRKIILMSACVLFAIVLVGTQVTPDNFMLFYYTRPILLEFVVGMMLGYLYLKNAKVFSAPIYLPVLFMAVGIITPFLMQGAYAEQMETLATYRIFVLGIPALLIVWSALSFELMGLQTKKAIFLLLGGASYALYLFHPLILQTAIKVMSAVGGEQVAGQPFFIVVAALLALFACSVACVGIHLYIENPITKLIGRRSVFSKVRNATK